MIWTMTASASWAALDDAPAGLAELRAVLLQEHVWRRAEGLA
jgi:hypothetical protein